MSAESHQPAHRRAEGRGDARQVVAADGLAGACVDRDHPRNIEVKAEALVPGLDRWLASLFDDDTL